MLNLTNMDITQSLRKKIDKLDYNLLKLLKKRFDLCKQIGKLKYSLNQDVIQPQRNHEVVSTFIKNALKFGLCEHFCKNLITLIMQESCKIQKQ